MSNNVWPSILDQVILPIILTLYTNPRTLTLNYLKFTTFILEIREREKETKKVHKLYVLLNGHRCMRVQGGTCLFSS
jgi:hypothetical protein